jgi:cysteine desulfurase family protein (TIGR01976 family)
MHLIGTLACPQDVSMPFDLPALRAEFPALESGVAYFDGPGGSQTPRTVGEAIYRTMVGPLSNRGSLVVSQRNADAAVLGFRAAMADLLHADPRGIVYGRSATQITYDFSRALAKQWQPGDIVVVSRLDHDANVRPWIQAADAVGAEVRWIDFDPETSEVIWSTVEAAITERTRLVAITAASNLIGTIPPVRKIADLAHGVGALTYVDGVHYTAHALVDVQELGADFYVCSPYKFHGPHCAALAAAPALLETIWPDKLAPSTDEVPERFEFGTLPYEIMAGVTAAVDFLAGVDPGTGQTRRECLTSSLHSLETHESTLRMQIEADLAEIEGVTVYSRARHRTPTLLFSLAGRSATDASRFLASRDVLAPAGSFYAMETYDRLGLDEPAAVRVGLAPYTNEEDVQRLYDALVAFAAS